MESAFDQRFISSINQLDARDSQRIWTAVEKYQRSPAAVGLHLEKLQGGRNLRLWTIRASQELRVLIAREGPVSVFLRGGHHDDIYDFAEHFAFVAPHSGKPGLIPIRPQALAPDGAIPAPAPPRPGVRDAPSIVEHWSTGELARAGFTQAEVDLLRRATQETLLDVWPDIGDDKLDLIMDICERSPEDWRQRQLLADDEASRKRFRDAVVERGALAGLSSLLAPEELQRLMSAPIEDWMIFLHPDQRALVDRSFAGPARVRGSAGTGKTVVALHRAAALAKRFADGAGRGRRRAPILFTTFIKSLPPVFKNLYGRLPAAIEGAVEFVNVDRLAYRLCAQTGSRPNLDLATADTAFRQSHEAVVRPGTPLHRARLTARYLRDEVTAVLKGRGVESLEEYLRLERTGRRTPFSAAMREQVWELREEWDRRLGQAGIVDFPDIVRRARDLARSRQEPVYRAAIVDESQDLTLVGLQLIRALVGDAGGRDQRDALFIVGDGAQKIYPGGFTLAQAGVDVRGNSAVLRVNYRNTRQIIDAALACAGAEPVDDLGDEYRRGDAAAEAHRGGVRPYLVRAESFGAQIAYVVERAGRLGGTGALDHGDIGVFTPTNQLAQQVIGGIEAAGLRCQPLNEFDGRPSNAIKVGTFHRAKGLEFKVTFVLGVSSGRFPMPRSRETSAEYNERQALEISELFVAMTRARDGLFVLYSNEPSDVLIEALDYFEVEAWEGG